MDLDELREKINDYDKKIVELVAERLHLSDFVAKYKEEEGLSRSQPEREKFLIEKWRYWATTKEINPDVAEAIFKIILKESHNIQKKTID